MNKRQKKKKNKGCMDWYQRTMLRNIFINIFKMKYCRAIGKGSDFGTQPMTVPRRHIILPCYIRFKTFKDLNKKEINKRRKKYE